jgi:hypothetical protein
VPDKVENNLINTSYKYKDTELSVYDTDQDGEISIFEIEQIEDELAEKYATGLKNSKEVNDEVMELRKQTLKDSSNCINGLY